jgi:hypothetical protein
MSDPYNNLPNLGKWGEGQFGDQQTWQCYCTGKGPDGLCKCERLSPWMRAPSNVERFEKPRIRVKARSEHWVL